jgi:F420-dependent oxidoreductase-like protein
MQAIRLGALAWNQYTTWPALLAAGRLADSLGYDSLWTYDHLYPIIGDSRGPIFESWMTLSAWAQATSRIRIGTMVTANTFREPALLGKMVTTLDHASGGRAILGIGAGWFEEEHAAFGIPYGTGAPERLRWLAEALPVIRGMLHGERPSAPGRRYHAHEVRNDPAPLQRPLPILVGGSGERVTLRLVAQYADACNIGGGIEQVRRKDAVLRQHCAAIGRDEREIERTTNIGVVVIRDSREDARRAFEAQFAHNRIARLWQDQPVGTPEDVAAHLAAYLEVGYRHLVAGFPAPHDEESIARLAREVRPAVERG